MRPDFETFLTVLGGSAGFAGGFFISDNPIAAATGGVLGIFLVTALVSGVRALDETSESTADDEARIFGGVGTPVDVRVLEYYCEAQGPGATHDTYHLRPDRTEVPDLCLDTGMPDEHGGRCFYEACEPPEQIVRCSECGARARRRQMTSSSLRRRT